MASNLGGWGLLPIMVYTVIQGGSAPKEYLFQASGQYDRVGISLVEVYERISKPVISVCKKVQKGGKMHFIAVKKLRNPSGFVILFITAVKMDTKF